MASRVVRTSNYYGEFISGKVYHDELNKNRIHVEHLRIGAKRVDIEGRVATISELEMLKEDIDKLIDTHKKSCEIEDMINSKTTNEE